MLRLRRQSPSILVVGLRSEVEWYERLDAEIWVCFEDAKVGDNVRRFWYVAFVGDGNTSI